MDTLFDITKVEGQWHWGEDKSYNISRKNLNEK